MSTSSPGTFRLGATVDPESHDRRDEPLLYESGDLTTHGVIVGMTGSGKTGLAIDLLEEVLADGIPTLVLDPSGDMGNLLLTFSCAPRTSDPGSTNASPSRRVRPPTSSPLPRRSSGPRGWPDGTSGRPTSPRCARGPTPPSTPRAPRPASRSI